MDKSSMPEAQAQRLAMLQRNIELDLIEIELVARELRELLFGDNKVRVDPWPNTIIQTEVHDGGQFSSKELLQVAGEGRATAIEAKARRVGNAVDRYNTLVSVHVQYK